jgi:hypothetical protein
MQGPDFLGDHPIRNQRIEAIECRCDDVQFGVDVGMQESVGIVDGFVAAGSISEQLMNVGGSPSKFARCAGTC